MNQPKRLLLILVMGGILAVLANLYGPGGAQRRGMRAAAAHREHIVPAVEADPRFSNVRLAVTTHPGLLALGSVPDSQALTDLERRLQPPDGSEFQLMISVKIVRKATTREGASNEVDRQ